MSSLPPRPTTGGKPPRPATAGSGAVMTPMPPVLSYINDKLRSSSAASRRPPSRPSTAASTMSRPATADLFSKKIRKTRTFLKDNEATETLLPQPLPDGIPYVAQFTTFDDLIDRNILQQAQEQQVHLTTSEVKLMYEAKCLDQNLKSTWDREVRFMELLSAHCKGNFFTLRENGLGAASAEAIARVLAHNEHYSIVDLSGNRFRDAGAQCIAQLLQINDTIVHLSLKSNDVGHDGGVALAAALEQNNTLTSLDLGGISGINRNHLGAQGAAAIGEMLSVNPIIAFLDVSSNGLGTEGIRLLAKGLEGGQNTTLIRANFASNNLATEGCAELGPALESTRLEWLDLQRNAMGDRGAAHIAHGLRLGTTIGDTLTELLLDSNGIRDIGCKAIGRYLKHTSKLKMLSMNDNPIGGSLKHLAESLLENRSVSCLHLSHCLIAAGDVTALAKCFAKNQILATLDLSKNRICDLGIKQLSDALRKNAVVTDLNLASNAIGDPGGEALAVMIRENNTITDLNLRQNLMSKAGAAIEEQLRKNSTIRNMDFNFNDFSFQAFSGITGSLQRNVTQYEKDIVPRLSKEIEELGTAHTELFHIQEDIDLEKRGVREKTDECSRLRETINNNTDRRRRTLEELREQVDAMKLEVMEIETKQREEAERHSVNIQRMEAKASSLRHQCEAEHEKRERALKDTERVRKQLKVLHDSEAESLKPLLEHYRKVDNDRNSDMADAKWQAENLVNAEIRIAQLEKSLGVAHAAPTSASPEPGSQSSPTASPTRRGGSAKKRK